MQLYPQLSNIALEPFNCQPEGLGLLAAGFIIYLPFFLDKTLLILQIDVRMPCPSMFSFTRIWAIACIIVFAVGIPIFSIMVMKHMGVDQLATQKVVLFFISNKLKR